MDHEVRPRSTTHSGTPSPRPSTKKIFNCVVDETALVAGVKRSTRNGLRQWVKNGQIRLFVPLYGTITCLHVGSWLTRQALEILNVQKTVNGRHGDDVRETLEWLDQATSKHPDSIALQGPDEVFASWEEVQQFAVPRSLFSESDLDLHASSADAQYDVANDISSFRIEHSRSSSLDTSEKLMVQEDFADFPQKDNQNDHKAESDTAVPIALRPLFNYILWRIHQEIDPVAALEAFIFLCNDQLKAHLAKGFEVRCKRLEQLRDTISREERDTKNRQNIQHRSTQSLESTLSIDSASTPPIAPAAMLKPSARVIDPDTFGRVPTSLRQNKVTPARGAYPNNRGGRGSTRGRGASNGNTPKQREEPQSSLSQSGGSPRFVPIADSEIDPNSFERPRGAHNGRGGRRLWMPT